MNDCRASRGYASKVVQRGKIAPADALSSCLRVFVANLDAAHFGFHR
jgi:hypothetical protein